MRLHKNTNSGGKHLSSLLFFFIFFSQKRILFSLFHTQTHTSLQHTGTKVFLSLLRFYPQLQYSTKVYYYSMYPVLCLLLPLMHDELRRRRRRTQLLRSGCHRLLVRAAASSSSSPKTSQTRERFKFTVENDFPFSSSSLDCCSMSWLSVVPYLAVRPYPNSPCLHVYYILYSVYPRYIHRSNISSISPPPPPPHRMCYASPPPNECLLCLSKKRERVTEDGRTEEEGTDGRTDRGLFLSPIRPCFFSLSSHERCLLARYSRRKESSPAAAFISLQYSYCR